MLAYFGEIKLAVFYLLEKTHFNIVLSETMESNFLNSFSLKALVVVSLLTAFLQVSLGGFVRVSESGLGCPDWPLCHGELIPPFEYHTMIEYSHRLTGTVLGVFIILMVTVVLFKYRHSRDLLILSICSLILVIFAGILGGITVVTELVWWIRLIHLGIAQALIAILTVLTGFLFLPYGIEIPYKLFKQRKKEIVYILVTIYLLILSGSYVVGTGASAVCTSWPLCQGFSLPWKEIYVIHMLHRYIAAIALLGMLFTTIKWLKTHNLSPRLKKALHSLFGLIAVQIIIGAIIIFAEFHPHIKAFHLSIATLVWIGAVYLSFVIYRAYPEKREQ